MAYRNLTPKFEKIRSLIKTPLTMERKFEDEEIELNYESGSDQWQEHVKSIESDIVEIQRRLAGLKRLHEEHVVPRFGKDYVQEEQQIEIQTASITDLFKRALLSMKEIGGDDSGVTTSSHNSDKDKLKKHVKTKLIMQLNDLSSDFKGSQRQFLQKLKGLKERRKVVGMDPSMEGIGDMTADERKKLEDLQDKIYQKGFDDNQMQQVLQNQRELLDRDRELQNILSSIVDLKSMFDQLNVMVVEQGTLMDRIDFNLEQAESHVDEGTLNLEHAERSQKCSMVTVCLIFIVITFLLVAVVLIIRIIWHFALPTVIP